MTRPPDRSQRQRLFLAVRPPERVAAALAGLPRPDQPGVRWAAPETWHITLRFLARAAVADVVDAVTPLMPPPPAEVALGPRVTTLASAVVVPVRGLDALADRLLAATVDQGRGGDGERPFLGHLTLARLRTPRTACPLVGHRFEARFELDAVELIASEQLDGRYHHRSVHAWPRRRSG